MVVQPSNVFTVTANLQISSDVKGTLLVNGAAAIFTTTRVGQNASYTFSGTAGQNRSVLISGNTFAGYSSVVVTSPDGTEFSRAYVYNWTDSLVLTGLPLTGNYTVRIIPYQGGTGTMSVALTQ